MIAAPRGKHAKHHGAYYTDKTVADFIVQWAIRSASDTVLDPSFGGGVFLTAALTRLESLGGKPAQVSGVEIDTNVHKQVSDGLNARFELPTRQLIRANFYDLTSRTTKPVDAVVGNPPYIRYQTFKGAARAQALTRMKEQGVRLNGLASSWASFVVHSCSLLNYAGRLAMVIPSEIGHAPFARPVLEYLVTHFARVHWVTFQQPLFPDLGQDTLLLLADNKGAGRGQLYLTDLGSSQCLHHTGKVLTQLERAAPISDTAISSGNAKLNHSLLAPAAQELYQRLGNTSSVALGDLATVGIGYVSGANGFFHLTKRHADALGIDAKYLKKAVFRGKAFSGLAFTRSDFSSAELQQAGYLLQLNKRTRLSPALAAYIKAGEAEAVHLAYKCRVRSPWYSVPGATVPDAFLTYMSGLYPQLVVNSARTTAPNTLLHVTLQEAAGVDARILSLVWQSSLTALSAELEGHALGGGMLKLEPGEARNVRLALPRATIPATLFKRVDSLLRAGKRTEATQLVDQTLLQTQLGLSQQEVEVLRRAAETLRRRRYYKARAAPISSAAGDH